MVETFIYVAACIFLFIIFLKLLKLVFWASLFAIPIVGGIWLYNKMS